MLNHQLEQWFAGSLVFFFARLLASRLTRSSDLYTQVDNRATGESDDVINHQPIHHRFQPSAATEHRPSLPKNRTRQPGMFCLGLMLKFHCYAAELAAEIFARKLSQIKPKNCTRDSLNLTQAPKL